MLLVGVKKEDVKVELEEENILKISGENMKEEEEEENVGDTWHRLELAAAREVNLHAGSGCRRT